MDFLRTSLSSSFLHFVSRILLLSIRGLKPQHSVDSDAALTGRSSSFVAPGSTSCFRLRFVASRSTPCVRLLSSAVPVPLLLSDCTVSSGSDALAVGRFLLPVFLVSGSVSCVQVLLLAPCSVDQFNLSSYRPVELFCSPLLHWLFSESSCLIVSGRKRLRRDLLHVAASQAKHALATTGKGQVMRRDEGGKLMLAM